jgi:hypothetical protein
MTYTLKHYKALRSGAYTASLWLDDARVARVEDDGQGGQPRVSVTEKGASWAAHDALLNSLTSWAQGNVPEWYLTSHGAHQAVSPDWEVALGYLTECAELNRLTKGKRLMRRPDGTLWHAAATLTQAQDGALLWHNGDWVTTIPAGAAL